MFLRCKIFFHPQNWALIRRGAQGKSNDKPRCGASITGFVRKDFVYGAALQAIPEDAVNGIVTEVKGGAMRGQRILLTQRRNVAPQRRKIDGCHYGGLSMFMICSIMESYDGKSQEGCTKVFLAVDAGGENDRRHGAFDAFQGPYLIQQFVEFLD